MGTRRLPRGLWHVFHVRAGEKKVAVFFFSYFFLIAAAVTVIKTLRTTDFLVRMGVGGLPIAYLLAAIVTWLVVLFHARVQFRTSLRAVVTGSLVLFGLTGLALQWALGTRAGKLSAVLPYVYWVWASVLVVALLTHFWMAASERFDPREAKRLMGFLSWGGILGGVLGGLLVGLLSRTPLRAWLLPFACVLLFGGAAAARAAFTLPQREPAATERAASAGEGRDGQKPGFKDSFEAVRKNRFLALVAGIVAIGVVVSTCIEFQYLSASFLRFSGDRQALQAFFGFFDVVLTVFALLPNLLIGGYLVKKMNAARVLLLPPGVLLAASLAVLRMPFGLLSGMVIRASDESMAFAVNQSVRELLYIPVPARLRHTAKPFIEMFVSQMARVAGAIVLLAFALALNMRIEGLTPVFNPALAHKVSWVVLALLIPWAVMSIRAGRAYLDTLRESIHPLWPRADRDLAAKVDVEQAKLVFDTVDSLNVSSALYALHLFDLLARDELTPEVRKILAERSGEVRAATVADRFEAEGSAHFLDALDGFRPETLLAEVPLIMSSDEYQRVMMAYLRRIRKGGPGAEVEKMEMAKAIGLTDPASPLASELHFLIDDESPRVARLALKSAARLGREDHIPAVIRKLGDPATMADAADTLQKYGDRALPALEKKMNDLSQGLPMREAAVGVLARIGTPGGLRALAEELEYGSGALDRAVIDVLDRLRSEGAAIPLSAAAAEGKLRSLARDYCLTYLELRRQAPGEGATPSGHRLAGRLQADLADIFKLLGLTYPQEGVRTAYQNITSGGRRAAAHAVEWLDNALKSDIRELVVPLVEDLDPDERGRRLERILKAISPRPPRGPS